MIATIKSAIFVITTIATISSWAGGYIERTPAGFHVEFSSSHARVGQSSVGSCRIMFGTEAATCAT